MPKGRKIELLPFDRLHSHQDLLQSRSKNRSGKGQVLRLSAEPVIMGFPLGG